MKEDTKLFLASILAWSLVAYGFWQVWSLVRIKTKDWKALRDYTIKAVGAMAGAWVLFLQFPY